jgi:Holliday junction DNA helicase RuvA
MIAALRGRLISRKEDNLVIDVNGVGYLVAATMGVLEKLPMDERSEEISLQIFTDVKENSIALFGFASTLEREVFLLLKKVSGIGSKTALALISGVGAEGLLQAIGSGDTSRLTKVSGVGKKTAERTLVELREQVKEFLPQGLTYERISYTTGKKQQIGQGLSGSALDAVLALEKLGFPEERAGVVVKQIVSRIGEVDAGDLLSQALRELTL